MQPVVCMITNRRAGHAEGEDELVRRVGIAAQAGVHIIQVRERDLDGRRLTDLVRRCVAAVRSTRARVVVNDRIDVALAAGAHGVHLRGESIDAARVRSMAPAGFIVGRSVHTSGEAARVVAGGGLDYLIFGTVFPSHSKPGIAGAGYEELVQAARATSLPVLAVGGVAPETIPAIARAGVAGFAAIGLFASGSEAALPAGIAAAQAAFARTIAHQLPTTDHQQPTTDYQLPTTD